MEGREKARGEIEISREELTRLCQQNEAVISLYVNKVLPEIFEKILLQQKHRYPEVDFENENIREYIRRNLNWTFILWVVKEASEKMKQKKYYACNFEECFRRLLIEILPEEKKQLETLLTEEFRIQSAYIKLHPDKWKQKIPGPKTVVLAKCEVV